jgi:hypothetical protein
LEEGIKRHREQGSKSCPTFFHHSSGTPQIQS